MLKKLKNSNQGFTIIEVLIVLAIAALIILIVFLAVPALQRNARNTSRRNDVAKLLGLATEFSSNNNGKLPDKAICFGDMILDTVAGGTQKVQVTGAYYCKGTATIKWDNTVTANPNDPDVVILRSSAVCNGTSGDAVVGSSRSIVALYTLENGIKQCQAS